MSGKWVEWLYLTCETYLQNGASLTLDLSYRRANQMTIGTSKCASLDSKTPLNSVVAIRIGSRTLLPVLGCS